MREHSKDRDKRVKREEKERCVKRHSDRRGIDELQRSDPEKNEGPIRSINGNTVFMVSSFGRIGFRMERSLFPYSFLVSGPAKMLHTTQDFGDANGSSPVANSLVSPGKLKMSASEHFRKETPGGGCDAGETGCPGANGKLEPDSAI
jgi:hypothetical protein